ncbi:MAG: glycosyltransferase family 4 protein [Actinomycetota bacterium]
MRTRKDQELRLLLVPGKDYPTDHAMLETIYAKILPQQGVSVTWIMRAHVDALPRESWHESTVVTVPTHRVGEQTIPVNRWLAWFRLLAGMSRESRKLRPDVVQVRNSVTAGLMAWWLRRRDGSSFVYQVSFPVPESLARAARQGRTRLPLLRAAQARAQLWLRARLLRRADLVLAISDEMRDRFIAAGTDPQKVMSFPLGSDLPISPPGTTLRRRRQELGVGEDPLVLYFGTIAPDRQLGFLLDVAALVRPRFPAARWILIGPASEGEDERLRVEIAARDLGEEIRVLPRIARTDLTTTIAAADVVVSPIPMDPLFIISSPTKTVEALAQARPVVGTPIPDQAALIRESGGGVVAPFDPAPFAIAVCDLLENPSGATEMGGNGQRYVIEHRSYARLASSVLDRYRQIARSSGGSGG